MARISTTINLTLSGDFLAQLFGSKNIGDQTSGVWVDAVWGSQSTPTYVQQLISKGIVNNNPGTAGVKDASGNYTFSLTSNGNSTNAAINPGQSTTISDVFNGGIVYLIFESNYGQLVSKPYSSDPSQAWPTQVVTTSDPIAKWINGGADYIPGAGIAEAVAVQPGISGANGAFAQNYGYVTYELSLLGESTDGGDITAINSYSFPTSFEVFDSSSVSKGSVGFNNPLITEVVAPAGEAIHNAIQDAAVKDSNPFLNFNYLPQTTLYKTTADEATAFVPFGPTQMSNSAITPAASVVTLSAPGGMYPLSPAPFQSSDWHPYLTALAQAAPHIEFAGTFEGAGSVINNWQGGANQTITLYNNPSYYDYVMTWSDSLYLDGSNTPTSGFLFSPSGASQTQGYIVITKDSLANSIYSTLGNFEVYPNNPTSAASSYWDGNTPYMIANSTKTSPGSTASPQTTSEINTGVNNQWGSVFTQLLAGLDSGLIGSQGLQTNSVQNSTGSANKGQYVNLNWNGNFSPSYLFGADNYSHVGDSATQYYDKYSQAITTNSNAYGNQYSDQITSGYSSGGPLISVADSSGNSYPNINLKVFGSSEMATGYTPPVFANGSTVTTFGSPQAQTTADTLKLVLSNANSNSPGHTSFYVDPSHLAIQMRAYDATVNQWSSPISLPTSGDEPQSTPWNNYGLKWTAGSGGSVGALSIQTVNGQAAPGYGSILFNNLPITNTASTYTAYQITFTDTTQGAAIPTKTVTLYAQSDGNGNFSSGSQVDGGVNITTTTGANSSISLDFTTAVPTIMPSLIKLGNVVTADGLPTGGTPSAPVMSYGATGPIYDILTGQNTVYVPEADQSLAPDNTGYSPVKITPNNLSNIGFGWAGTNLTTQQSSGGYLPSNADMAYLASDYTNLVSAQDIIKITVSPNTNGDPNAAIATSLLSQTVYAQADLGGQWQSGQSLNGQSSLVGAVNVGTTQQPIWNGNYSSIPLNLAPYSGGYTILATEYEPSSTYNTLGSQMGLTSSSLTVKYTATTGSINTTGSTAISSQNTTVWELYDSGLGRIPDTGGFNFYSGKILTMGQTWVANTILYSQEGESIYGTPQTSAGQYNNFFSNSNTEFLNALYAHTFGRAPDPGVFEGGGWYNYLNSNMSSEISSMAARSNVFQWVATSNENAQGLQSMIDSGHYWTVDPYSG